MHLLKFHTTIVAGAVLLSCGGDAKAEQSTATPVGVKTGVITLSNSTYVPKSRSYVPVSRGTTTLSAPPASPPSTAVSAYVPKSRDEIPSPPKNGATAATVTDVRFESTSSSTQTNVPVTFGQVFAPGNLASGASLSGRLDNGAVLPLQLDVKALHPDGSVRHAIVSAILPALGAGQVVTMSLDRAAARASAPDTTASLLNSGFNASVNVSLRGVRYSVAADELMRKVVSKAWLSGSTANEWLVSAPLTSSSGAVHPHLSVRFAVRWYQTIQKARVDVTIENNWAYEPSPQNFTYDAQILVGGNAVYAKNALTHYHHARWRKVFWWNGAAPKINVKHNTRYLIASRALPNYDQSLRVPESALNDMKAKWTKSNTEPMGTGLTTTYMPQTGGRSDIGLLPQWAAVYVLSMDQRARDATLGTGELAGSFSSHYRDKKTGQPVSLLDYPYMTVLGRAGDTFNPATQRREAFPSCPSKAACATPYTHDVSHQPSLAYVPYMLTGDHFFLEELQFWGMYNVFNSNPGYRENGKGLVHPEQVRGQAWALRTLAQAAYITPDSDRLKQHFKRILDNNLAWFNANYTDNSGANKLGVITNGYAIVYLGKTGVAPWQDDFFTSAIGHASDLGFTEATRLLQWKAKFAVDRMVAPGACWIDASMYSMRIRASATSPVFSSMAEAYRASHDQAFNKLACASMDMARALKLSAGEMTGYSSATAGYPANMQPALAYAADVGGTAGQRAWEQFMKRSVKPNYATSPQFAIVPR